MYSSAAMQISVHNKHSHDLTKPVEKIQTKSDTKSREEQEETVHLDSLFLLLELMSSKLTSIPQSYIVTETAFIQSFTLAVQDPCTVIMRKLNLPD